MPILHCDSLPFFYYCEINFVYRALATVLVVSATSGLNVPLHFDGKNGFKFTLDENIS